MRFFLWPLAYNPIAFPVLPLASYKGVIMTDAILQAYRAVEHAMEEYNKALLAHVEALRSSEKSDPDKLYRLTQGAKAMRDSSMIYLSYAKFIAHGMPDSEEMVGDELQS